jgi:transposase
MDYGPETAEILRTLGHQLPTRDALLCEVVEQRQIIAKKSEVISAQQKHIALLEERVRLLQAQRFGPSSEKSDGQLALFDEEAEAEAPPVAAPEPARKEKKRRGQKGLSPALPREAIYLRLSEEQKAGAMDTFFVKVKEELDITPAKVQVLEYWQEKAVIVEQDQRRIVEAERPRHPLGKAIVSVQLLAYLIVAKYCDALPLYRLEGILKRYGGSVTRTTLAHWLIRLSLQLQPLINLLRDEQLAADYLQGDETRVQVLKEPGLAASSKKWMWIMRGGPPDRPVVLFDYDRSRGKTVAERLLESFEGGYFQSDGYSSYDEICQRKGIVHLGCWDHSRRRFIAAEKAQPPAQVAVKPSKASEALTTIRALYRIESEIKALSAEEKREQRQLRSVPVLNAFKHWLAITGPKVLKGSLTREAIDYTLNQWPKLIRYCEHGQLNISNILAENAIRPFALGRKAWLFCDTPAGARASAIYFSLVETAKANGLEPYDYLCKVIRQIPYAETVEDMEALLPWNMK